jgi:peptidoglycan hydrolase-like amidase
VTPYFSSSDGRTRSWSEVWNGDYPWLVSVPDPCCTTHTLLGHGVGMSGDGAVYFADNGWGYKKILKYYYTGVEVEKRY